MATTLQIGASTGWGIYGLNVALQMVKRGIQVVPVAPCEWTTLLPSDQTILASTQAIHAQFLRQLASAAHVPDRRVSFDGDALFCLGKDLIAPQLGFSLQGKRNIAIAVFEAGRPLAPEAAERAKAYHKIITGSNWNADFMRGSGVENVAVVLQGVDTKLFSPGPRTGKWKNHFVIFSGGKLEYRKGQDIVVEAMRIFQRHHPDALLVFAWHNFWPYLMEEIDLAGLVKGPPDLLASGQIDFAGWLRRHDVKNFVDLGPMCNWEFPAVLREADVAIFPSRAEGATNFAAMEAIASGVPTILSANTGHLELIPSEETCYPLKQQPPARPSKMYPDVQGWGESSVDEIVQTLEQIYANREQANRRGTAGAQWIERYSWQNQIDKLLAEIG